MVKDWNSVQDELRQLYHVENRTLREVMRLVKGKHGFIASERAYRTQLQTWGYMKYSTQNFPKSGRSVRPARRSVPRTTTVPNMGYSVVNSTGAAALPSTAAAFGNFEPSPGVLQFDPSTASLHSSNHNFHRHLPPPSSFPFSGSGYPDDGRTPLHLAVLAPDRNQVENLLFGHAAVNVKDSSGNDPLHYAAQGGSLEIVSLLLSFGADVHAKGEDDRTPLHMAVRHLGVVRALLKEGASSSSQDRNGDTPLHLVFSGIQTLLDRPGFIIDAFLEHNCDVNIQNNEGITPFLQLLNQRPASLKNMDKFDFRRNVQQMIQNGGDVMKSGKDGGSPLQVFLSNVEIPACGAFSYGEIETLEDFLQKGASYWTPMPDGRSLVERCFNAVTFDRRWKSQMSLARLICSLAKPDTVVNGTSVLHELTRVCGNTKLTVELAQILLRNGADPNAKNGDGKTPLLLALETRGDGQKAKDVILGLVEKGADPWLSEPSSNCVLYAAFKMFSKTCPIVLTEILAMDVRNREKSNNGVLDTESTRTIADQWPNLAEALTARTWSEGFAALKSHHDSFPAAIDSVELRRMASTALAERHLRLAKERFNAPEQELSCVLEILRDCRGLGVALEMKHFDRLLDLCP